MSAVIIPARYGSSRFYGKVLAEIGGEPMISLVAKRCLDTKANSVIVVTDNEEVFNVCNKISNLKVIMSPKNIATGTDRVAFAAQNIDDDIIINVQGDEPFIPSKLINLLLDGLNNDNSIDMITACTPFANEELSLNPDNVKVVLDSNNFALYFSRYPIPYNRDKIDNVIRYRHIGIYGFRREYLFKFTKMERSNLEKSENLEQLRALENGAKIKVVITDYNPISIDTPKDLEYAKSCLDKELK